MRKLSWRRNLATHFALFLGLAFLSHVAVAAEPWTVASVLGGHSMKLVRGEESQLAVLYGVKAPKLDTPEGDVAKQFLQELVLNQPVYIHVVRESRGMNYVTVELEDGTDPAAVLLQYGLVEWDKVRAPEQADYAALQDQAQTNKLGIWGNSLSETTSVDRSYVLQSDAEGYREIVISDDGSTTLRMKGNETPNYELQARVNQERLRRAEERRQLLEEQARRQAEALRQQQVVAAQAKAQAREDYLYNLQAQEQYLRNQNLYLNNEYWRWPLYGRYYPYGYHHRYYPYPRSYSFSVTHSSSSNPTPYMQNHGATQSPFLNVFGTQGVDNTDSVDEP